MKLINKLLKYVSNNNSEPTEETGYRGENFDNLLNQKIKEKETHQKKVEKQLKDGIYEPTEYEERLLQSIEDKRQSIIKLYEQTDWTQEEYIGRFEITNLKVYTEKLLEESFIGIISKLDTKNLNKLCYKLYKCNSSLEQQLLSQEITEILKNIFKILQSELTWKTYNTFDIELKLRKSRSKETIEFKKDGILVIKYWSGTKVDISYTDIYACEENLNKCKEELKCLMKMAKMI